jgi:hypothetical protein
MSRIDLFESTFRSASKMRYAYREVIIEKVLVVCDGDEAATEAFTEHVRGFLSVLEAGRKVTWRRVPGSAFRNVGELLKLVEESEADLICTYRNLHSSAWRWPYTLGSYVMALSQEPTPPVLIVPHPEAHRAAHHAMKNTDQVMAITDHLTGDSSLVSTALAFLEPEGTLHLAHVEDAALFERYLEVISKIPAIDTAVARETILEQLLKEPADYIASVRDALSSEGLAVQIEETVTVGARLAAYRRLIDEHTIDLLVFHARDDEQLAMHGLAYPLAVEIRDIPLLLI